MFALFQKFVKFQNLFYIRLQKKRKDKSIENKSWNEIKFFFVVCTNEQGLKIIKANLNISYSQTNKH